MRYDIKGLKGSLQNGEHTEPGKQQRVGLHNKLWWVKNLKNTDGQRYRRGEQKWMPATKARAKAVGNRADQRVRKGVSEDSQRQGSARQTCRLAKNLLVKNQAKGVEDPHGCGLSASANTKLHRGTKRDSAG